MLTEQCQRSLSHTLTASLVLKRSEQSLPEGEMLHAWLLLCGDAPTASSDSGLPLLEGLLPDIRLLAILSAAQRCQFADGCRTPANLSDEADWLAARITVLGASYVQMTPEQLPLLQLANERLQTLAALSGCHLPCAAAMLQPGGAATATHALRLWGSQDQDLAAQGGNVMALSREMARRGRLRVAPLLCAFGAL